MKTTMRCPVCDNVFTRVHTIDKPPRCCSRACANRLPGRMTDAVRARIARPSPRNTGGTITRGRSGRPYVQVHVPLATRHLHPTTDKRGRILRSHLVWDRSHPDDPVLPGEVVHHIDNDSLNDSPENLAKLPSQSAHARHHFTQPRRARSAEARLAASLRMQAKFPIEPRDCEQCGTPLTRTQIQDGGRFCSAPCHYAFRTGKGRTGW